MNGENLDTFWRSLSLALLGIEAVVVWLLFLHLTVLRNRFTAPVPIPIVMIFGLMTGAIYGAINYLGAPLCGLEMPPRPAAKVIFMSIFTLWWGVGTTLFFEARERFHKTRQELIERAVQIERLRMHEANVATALRNSMNDEIGNIVNERLSELARKEVLLNANVPSKNWRFVSSHIRATSNSAIRPLSHRLMREKSKKYPLPSYHVILRNVIRTQPFRPLVVSALYTLSVSPTMAASYGLADALSKTAIIIASLTVLFLTANNLMKKYPQHHSKIYVTAVLVLQIGNVLSAIDRSSSADDMPLRFSIFLSVLSSLIIILGSSAFGSLRKAHLSILDNFQSDLDEQTIEAIARSRQLAEIARETALVLHGSVQSRLNSCALAIDEASKSGNLQQCQEAFKLALQTLAKPLDAAIITDDFTAEAVVKYVSEPWSGLCEIEAYMDELHIPEGSLPSKSLTYFLEEAVSNAVRHGQARSIFIHFEKAATDLLKVTVIDDGLGLVGPHDSLSPLIHELTAGTAKIQNHEKGGAMVQATFNLVSV